MFKVRECEKDVLSMVFRFHDAFICPSDALNLKEQSKDSVSSPAPMHMDQNPLKSCQLTATF